MTLAEYLAEVKKRVAAATGGPGQVLHTEPMSAAIENKVVEAFKESVRASRQHEDGLPWWWIETADGVKIAEFGCGPTSEANALFWAHARTDIPLLLAIIEEQAKALEVIAEFKTGYPNHIATDAVARIDALIAKGEK